MSVAIEPRMHPSGWLLLLPLLILLIACNYYDLIANIRVDYRWLLAVVVSWHALAAAITWWASHHGWRWSTWLPGIATVPAVMGVLVFAGPVTFATAVLLALACLGLGSLAKCEDSSSTAISLIVGLAFIAAIVGWLLPLPVHYRWVYLLLTVAIIILRRRNIADVLRNAGSTFRELASAQPQWLILLIGSATIASLGLWLPSLNYDDNAVHLILPSQLLFDGYYHLDVQTQSWAVAPWANNVLHAVAMVLANGEARAAVALVWLLLGIAGAWRLARALDASPGTALAAAAVFASQPLTGYFTTTMQVDGASTAILMNFAAMAVGPNRNRLGAVLVGAICGLLLALKTSNMIYTLPLLAWLIAAQSAGTRIRWTAAMLATLLLIGGSCYTYALLVTGNPLFPFYNAVFQSPYFPLKNLRDLKWMAGISWRTLWDLTFQTGRFGQFYAGAAGIALLAVLPALLIDAVRRPASRWLLLWAFATGWLVFYYMQYLRYIFPALSVLTVLGVVALARFVDRRALAVVVVALVLVNAALMPTTSWIARENHWAQLLRDGPAARDGIVRKVIPERALLERVMESRPNACVLMTDPKNPFVGAGHGHAMAMHSGYDPELWQARKQANADETGNAWSLLLSRIGPSVVIVDANKSALIVQAMEADGYRLMDHESSQQAWIPGQARASGCNSSFRSRRNQAVQILALDGKVQ